MNNKYFPDEEIGFNDIYFVCYMIERIARKLHQHNRYVVERMGENGLYRQLSLASTTHCLNPLQVEDDWIAEFLSWSHHLRVEAFRQLDHHYHLLPFQTMPSTEQ